LCGINSADIDLAVRLGSLPDSSMVATRVGRVRRVVCGSPSYFSAHGIPRTPADLADLTCVTFANLAAGTSWSFASRSKDLAQAPRPRCHLNVNTAEAAIDAAIAGIGITDGLIRSPKPSRGQTPDRSDGLRARTNARAFGSCRSRSFASKDAQFSGICGTSVA
jgi:DNA-binding transcriptional LysR family regulator